MADLGQILKRLRSERTETHKQLGRLEEAIAVFERLVGRSGGRAEHKKEPRGRRTLSTVARKKIAAAQRARWAKVKQEKKAA